MDRGQGDRDLNERKQALVAESARNRLALRRDLQSIRAGLARFDRAAARIKRLGPWLLGAASLGGLLARRQTHGRKPGSLFGTVISLARWISPVLSLWRRYASGSEHRFDDP